MLLLTLKREDFFNILYLLYKFILSPSHTHIPFLSILSDFYMSQYMCVCVWICVIYC